MEPPDPSFADEFNVPQEDSYNSDSGKVVYEIRA